MLYFFILVIFDIFIITNEVTEYFVMKCRICTLIYYGLIQCCVTFPYSNFCILIKVRVINFVSLDDRILIDYFWPRLMILIFSLIFY